MASRCFGWNPPVAIFGRSYGRTTSIESGALNVVRGVPVLLGIGATAATRRTVLRTAPRKPSVKASGHDVFELDTLYASTPSTMAALRYRAVVRPMAAGFPRHPIICLRVRIARWGVSESPSSGHSASELKSSITLNSRMLRPSARWSA
jgi:hypothetical protein